MRILITLVVALSISCASACATTSYQGDSPEHTPENAASADE